ncbi:unnamed protein product [Urochloa humidicola]
MATGEHAGASISEQVGSGHGKQTSASTSELPGDGHGEQADGSTSELPARRPWRAGKSRRSDGKQSRRRRPRRAGQVTVAQWADLRRAGWHGSELEARAMGSSTGRHADGGIVRTEELEHAQ